jgi:hypothetical protein
MFIMTNFIYAIATIVDMILSIYMWIIIARAIFLSDHVRTRRSSSSRLVLQRIRRIFAGNGIDLSPWSRLHPVSYFVWQLPTSLDT